MRKNKESAGKNENKRLKIWWFTRKIVTLQPFNQKNNVE